MPSAPSILSAESRIRCALRLHPEKLRPAGADLSMHLSDALRTTADS